MYLDEKTSFRAAAAPAPAPAPERVPQPRGVGDVVEHLQAHRRRSRHLLRLGALDDGAALRGRADRVQARGRVGDVAPSLCVASAACRSPAEPRRVRVGTRRGLLIQRAAYERRAHALHLSRRRRHPRRRQRGRAPRPRSHRPARHAASKRASATSGAAASAGGSDRTYTSRTWRHPMRRRVFRRAAPAIARVSAARPVRQREVVPDERLAPR